MTLRRALNQLQAILDLAPRRAWFVLAFAYGLAILLVGMQPGDRLQLPLPEFDLRDKVLHFVAFAGLASVLFRGVYPFDPLRGPKSALASWPVLAIPLLLGTLDELGQGLTPGRTMDGYDLLADVTGAAAACTLGFALRHRARTEALRRRRRRRRALERGKRSRP